MVELKDLAAEQRSLLDAIVEGGKFRLAWVPVEELIADGHEGAVIDALKAKPFELVVGWALPTLEAVTLTGYGAWLMGVKILERMTVSGEELEEDPYWAEMDKEPPPLHLPKRRHEIRWPWMDEVPDPKASGPQVLEDEEGEPVRIMGRVVPIDRRMGKSVPKGKASVKGGKARRRRAG